MLETLERGSISIERSQGEEIILDNLQPLDRFLIALKACLAIGYSFRDSVIREIFINSLRKGPHKRIILVHPHPEDVIQLFPGLEDRFEIVKEHFGTNDYMKTNDEIIDRVNSIHLR